jgi:uncharacterized membrane protein YvbJ
MEYKKKKCPNCGVEDTYPSHIRFCPECGHELPGWESLEVKKAREKKRQEAKESAFVGDGYAE